MLALWSFIFLEIVYIRFHLDETPLFSFFINSLSCYQKIICGSSFIENKIAIRSSLTA
jgi:hypothetical protein